jgi:hypothetical protein
MSAAVVATKTPAATAMAGEKINNNQLKAACRRGHAAAKLLPPSCHCHCQAFCHCRAAAAGAALLPCFSKALPPTPKLRFCQVAASAAALLPPLLLPCHRAAHLHCIFAATGPLPLPMPRCHQQHRRLCFNHRCHCCHGCRFHHCCSHCFQLIVVQISDHFSISCCLGTENLGLHEVELTN